MEDLTSIEIGAGLLVLWFLTLFALWRLIDKQNRPGPIKSRLAKECLMLVHMTVLVVGIAMVVTGLHVVG